MIALTGYTLDEVNRIGWFEAMYADLDERETARRRIRRAYDGDDVLGRIGDDQPQGRTKADRRSPLR